MSLKCAKCKHEADGGSLVEGGVLYLFCRVCMDILESFPTNIMHTFLQSDDLMSQEDKNIFEARRQRAEGKSKFD